MISRDEFSNMLTTMRKARARCFEAEVYLAQCIGRDSVSIPNPFEDYTLKLLAEMLHDETGIIADYYYDNITLDNEGGFTVDVVTPCSLANGSEMAFRIENPEDIYDYLILQLRSAKKEAPSCPFLADGSAINRLHPSGAMCTVIASE